MEKNILIARMRSNDSMAEYNTVAADYAGGRHYAEQVSVGLGGIKSVLAQEHIDGVLLYIEGNESSRDYAEKHLAAYKASDDYNEINAEFTEILGMDRIKMLDGLMDEFVSAYCSERAVSEAEMYKKIISSADELKSAIKMVETMAAEDDRLSLADFNYIKHCIYNKLPGRCKMQCREDNKDCLIQIYEEKIEDSIYNDSLVNMISDAIETNGDSVEVNLYIYNVIPDFMDAYLRLNILQLIANQLNNVEIKAVYNAKDSEAFALVEDNTSQYIITMLTDGMNEFTDYGKVDKIINFVKVADVKDEAILSLVYAMRRTASGISLCDTDSIIDGISDIKAVVDKEHKFINKAAEIFYGIMLYCIDKTYGKLISGEEIDPFELAKWMNEKGMYQQALTIIESKTPGDMVKHGIYYYYDESSDEADLIEKFAIEQSHLKSSESYKMDDFDHYYIKTYPRSRVPRLSGSNTTIQIQRNNAEYCIGLLTTEDESLIKAFTKCKNIDGLTEAYFAYNYVGWVRNKINHAENYDSGNEELSDDITKDTGRMTMVQEAIDYFIKYYEMMREEVKGVEYVKRELDKSVVKKRSNELKDSYKKDKK